MVIKTEEFSEEDVNFVLEGIEKVGDELGPGGKKMKRKAIGYMLENGRKKKLHAEGEERFSATTCGNDLLFQYTGESEDEDVYASYIGDRQSPLNGEMYLIGGKPLNEDDRCLRYGKIEGDDIKERICKDTEVSKSTSRFQLAVVPKDQGIDVYNIGMDGIKYAPSDNKEQRISAIWVH